MKEGSKNPGDSSLFYFPLPPVVEGLRARGKNVCFITIEKWYKS